MVPHCCDRRRSCLALFRDCVLVYFTLKQDRAICAFSCRVETGVVQGPPLLNAKRPRRVIPVAAFTPYSDADIFLVRR